MGKILLNFFAFYGNFDHENVGISTHLNNKINEKPNHYPLLNVNSTFLFRYIVHDDPADMCAD